MMQAEIARNIRGPVLIASRRERTGEAAKIIMVFGGGTRRIYLSGIPQNPSHPFPL
jgi:hypothetical protein